MPDAVRQPDPDLDLIEAYLAAEPDAVARVDRWIASAWGRAPPPPATPADAAWCTAPASSSPFARGALRWIRDVSVVLPGTALVERWTASVEVP